MANPQAENGHIDIANEIGEALAKINLSGYESRVLWALFRKTYGWHKKEDRISVTQFQKITGLKRRHVSRALRALIRRNLVTKRGDGFIATYGFQKDYTKWKTVTNIGDTSPKGKTVTKLGDTLSPKEVTKLSPELVTTKEKKETIQKKNGETIFSPFLFKEKEQKQKKKNYLPNDALTREEKMGREEQWVKNRDKLKGQAREMGIA